MKTHLIWFNGTGEKKDDTKENLFKNLPNNITICSGWGSDGFKGDNITEVGAAVSGIKGIDDRYIREKFEEILKAIPKGTEKLIIGGFSRGAAFFVPSFLKYFAEETSKRKEQNFKKLLIILHDPVIGSKNSEDVTAKTLRDKEIYTPNQKLELIKKLKVFIPEISCIYAPVGFDKRDTNFHLDISFFQILKSKVWKDTFVTRLGISHTFLSSSIEARNKVIDSMTIDGQENLSLEKFSFGNFKSSLKNSKNFQILNSLFSKLLKNDSVNCSEILYLQNLTNAILNVATKIDYDKESIIYLSGNNETDLSVNNSRSSIIPQDTKILENLITNFRLN